MDPDDQKSNALEDASKAIAQSMQSYIKQTSEDDGTSQVEFYSSITIKESLIENITKAAKEKESWLDIKATGPLGLPNVLYILACISK